MNNINNIPMNNKDFSRAYMNPLIGGEKLSTPSGTSFNVNLSCPPKPYECTSHSMIEL
jgi:hypothetical protein